MAIAQLRRLYRPSIGIAAVVASVAACLAQPPAWTNPAWLNKVQFFSGIFYDWPSAPVTASTLPFTGQSWGFEPNPTLESLQRREVSTWHSLGRVYISGIFVDVGSNLFPNSAAARCIDVSGNPRSNFGPGYSLSSPDFRQYQKAQVKQAIDDGADGIQFDGATMLPDSITRGDGAYCFDAATMTAFRSYLTTKYAAAELLSQFNITDPASFDYRQWIIQRGIQKTWNQRPLTGLGREFFLFRLTEETAFLRQMTDFVHQYALQTYGRIATLSTNTAFARLGTAYLGAVDYFENEGHLFYSNSNLDYPLSTTYVKSYRSAQQGPVVVEPETDFVSGGATRFPVNMVRQVIADIYASGGTVSAGKEFEEYVGLLGPNAVDPAGLRRYGQFILGHPALFENLRTSPQVAILDSMATRMSLYGPIDSPEMLPMSDQFDVHYTGTAQILVDTNIQYDSLLAPDSTISAWPSFTLAQLQKYKVLVLPDTFMLDDGQVSTILDYVSGGGVVVATGSIGTHAPGGKVASRPDLLRLQAVEGATRYGNGTFVHTRRDLGNQYKPAAANGDIAAKAALRQALQSLISPYVAPDVAISSVTQVYRKGNATAFLYQNSSNAFILHLVNCDYDPLSDTFAAKDNLLVTVRTGSQPIDEVVLWSPDTTGPQVIPFSRSGDTVTFTVPHLDAWDVLSLQQNAAAPVIQSAVPGASVGAAGGSTLNFSASAQDADSNPLAYTWTVNGQVVTDALAQQYAFRVPKSASGATYTVVVTITDGSRTTQSSWTVTAAPFHSPRVLFDESHGEGATLDPARASQGNPTNPTRILFTDIANAMQAASYGVTPITAGPITASVLSNVDVLVLAVPGQAFTSAEMQAIWTFVKNGGGLVFLGDHGLGLGGGNASSAACNDLLAPFGLQMDARTVFSSDPRFNPGQPYVSTWVSHPALASLPDFQSSSLPAFLANYGGSFQVAAPAVALGSTSAAAWRGDTGITAPPSPGAGLGPFVMVAASQLGSGRVFAVSSLNPFLNQTGIGFFAQENQALFLSGLGWTSANVNPVPSVVPGAAPKFSQAANGASYTPALSPGSWVAIFGENLASTPAAGQTWTGADFQGNQLPTRLAGTSVLMNGRPAAISFASPAQLNVQAPDDDTEGPVTVQVSTPSGITQGQASIAVRAPAAFSFPGKGITYAAAVSSSGVLIARPADYAGARPAQPGEAISVFGTGFGPAIPPQPAGQLVQVAPLAAAVTATVCGIPAEVSWAGVVGPGLDQINLTIPSAGATGDCRVLLSIAGKTTPAGMTIPVQ